jgi:hypothetical protein
MSNLEAYLAERKRIAEKATYKSTGIERFGQVGYDLEGYAACATVHRDNPRKDHFERASNDAAFIADARNSQETLIRMVEVMREALGNVLDNNWPPGVPIDGDLGEMNYEGLARHYEEVATATLEAVERLAAGGSDSRRETK